MSSPSSDDRASTTSSESDGMPGRVVRMQVDVASGAHPESQRMVHIELASGDEMVVDSLAKLPCYSEWYRGRVLSSSEREDFFDQVGRLTTFFMYADVKLTGRFTGANNMKRFSSRAAVLESPEGLLYYDPTGSETVYGTITGASTLGVPVTCFDAADKSTDVRGRATNRVKLKAGTLYLIRGLDLWDGFQADDDDGRESRITELRKQRDDDLREPHGRGSQHLLADLRDVSKILGTRVNEEVKMRMTLGVYVTPHGSRKYAGQTSTIYSGWCNMCWDTITRAGHLELPLCRTARCETTETFNADVRRGTIELYTADHLKELTGARVGVYVGVKWPRPRRGLSKSINMLRRTEGNVSIKRIAKLMRTSERAVAVMLAMDLDSAGLIDSPTACYAPYQKANAEGADDMRVRVSSLTDFLNHFEGEYHYRATAERVEVYGTVGGLHIVRCPNGPTRSEMAVQKLGETQGGVVLGMTPSSGIIAS